MTTGCLRVRLGTGRFTGIGVTIEREQQTRQVFHGLYVTLLFSGTTASS